MGQRGCVTFFSYRSPGSCFIFVAIFFLEEIQKKSVIKKRERPFEQKIHSLIFVFGLCNSFRYCAAKRNMRVVNACYIEKVLTNPEAILWSQITKTRAPKLAQSTR